MGFAVTLGHRSLVAFGNPRVAPDLPVTITASAEKSARQSMSQQHQTGKRKVGIRLFKDLERFCVKAPFFDRFE